MSVQMVLKSMHESIKDHCDLVVFYDCKGDIQQKFVPHDKEIGNVYVFEVLCLL